MQANERLAGIFADLISSIGEVVKRNRVTPAEYREAIGFLEETATSGELPLLCDVFLGVAVDEANHPADGGTESNLEGPFYAAGAPRLERPYTLPQREDEPGEVLVLSGSVRSTDGTPITGALFDVWQGDAAGLYSNFMPGPPEWNLRGRFTSDDRGGFEVRTVIPAPYEIPKAGPTGRLLAALGRHAFRPAHIHVKLSHPDHESLTTQLYFEGDSYLGSDVVDAVKDSLVVRLLPGEGGQGMEAVYDFVLPPSAAKKTARPKEAVAG